MVATILMVALTVLLALLVLLFFSPPNLSWGPFAPSFLQIQAIHHHSDRNPALLNLDSRVVLIHSGTESLYNDALMAVFFRDQEPLPAVLSTLNGYRFIGTRHYGVQWIGGSGCSGETWEPGEKLVIDFTDGTFRPGNVVTVEIRERGSELLISRHTITA